MSGAVDPFAPAFAAEFGASPAPASTITNITVTPVNSQRVGVAFTVRGTFQIAAGALTYTDDKGVPVAIPVRETFTYSFVHPGFNAAGTQTITVGVPRGVWAKSNAFKVIKA